ncbi:MAG TPA: hypothetical protein VMU80_06595 [Bryobacteraceae bacterium]|nr:hypothetical protein [Bryobacteraceae bacterium]
MLTENEKHVAAWILLAGCLLLARASAQPNTATASFSNPTAHTAAPAASSVLPQFAFGGGWYSALYFTNLTGSAVSFPVNFVDDTGAPLNVPALGGSTTNVDLAARGTALIEAPNVGSLVQGYASFTLPAGVFGYGVFRQSVTGQPDQEAVVPLSDTGANASTLTWDETTFVTAVAVVNPGSTAANVTVTLYDNSGNTIGTSVIALPPNGKTATTLRSLPGLAGMIGKRGSALFSSSTGSVAVLGLRFDGLAFTSIPTTGAAGTTAKSSVLPQFAFGGGWYSALYFTNLTGSPVSFPVNFVSDAGAPLDVPALGGSTTNVSLAAHGTALIEAPNVGSLVEGYAAFTLPAGVFGYGVFRQSVAGQSDQEAVVPLSDTGANASTLTWDDTNFVTAVAVVNPSSTAANVTVTLYDNSGNTIGTSVIALPPNGKMAATLRSLPGLDGMIGERGSALFSASTGSVAVLGLRFNGLAFTSIPTTGAVGDLVAERALSQTGLAVGLASTVLQSQFAMLEQILEHTTSCAALTGGGSVRWTGGGNVAVYYDSQCTEHYVVTNPGTTVTGSGNSLLVTETATYYAPKGATLGTLTLNETAQYNSNNTWNLYGLGIFTPAAGAETPVQLGLWCSLSETQDACAGGIAQNFPALGIAIGGVTPLTLAISTVNAPVTFTGGGTAVTGPIGSLTLTNPSATSLVIQGGTPYSTITANGSAAAFVLFPPTPTSWTLADAAHDQQFQISVADNTTRNLTMTIVQTSSGITLATGAVDQSGTGTITYSDGISVAITNWTLAD